MASAATRKTTGSKLPFVVGAVIVLILLAVAVYYFIGMLGNSLSSVQYDIGNSSGSQGPGGAGSISNASVKDCLSAKGYTGLIFLHSPTCPHCRNMMPIIESLAAKGYKITKIDVTNSKQVADIMSCVKLQPYVPQFLCSEDGEIEIGEMGEDEVVALYNKCA
ncbi:MAG: thioredoxin family protein [Candidatus Micrarchaeota archaeon]|nr:thioredoxin family protein [Candidatus Micrarchaeota archaeon]